MDAGQEDPGTLKTIRRIVVRVRSADVDAGVLPGYGRGINLKQGATTYSDKNKFMSLVAVGVLKCHN